MRDKYDGPDEGWVTIAVRFSSHASVRFLSARFIRRDRPQRTRVFFTSPHVSKAGWFRPADATRILERLIDRDIYSAVIWSRA